MKSVTDVVSDLTVVDSVIDNIILHISITELSAYYTVFGSEEQRQTDLKKLRFELRKNLSIKHSLLDSLKLAATKEQSNISSKERDLSLSTETEMKIKNE